MFSMPISEIQDILINAHLLREVIIGDEWHHRITDTNKLTVSIDAISYYSKEVSKDTLFICKGNNFKRAYLNEALAQGVTFYVSENPYETADSIGFIVSDMRLALALLSREFYQRPDEQLKIIGITGTKGKTTTTYFTKDILEQAFPGKVGFISSQENSSDGKNLEISQLTTPEPLELFEILAKGVSNGLEYFVMEVSSQAYKMKRVEGITFDVGILLNFSPDHIGQLEHPTMEDYFYCKRELLHNSQKVLLFENLPHLSLLKEENGSKDMLVFGEDANKSDYLLKSSNTLDNSFNIEASNEDSLRISGNYSLDILGDFNKLNGLVAVLASSLMGVSREDAKAGLIQTHVPGRMEKTVTKNGGIVYVDFAHNYVSLQAILRFVHQEHPDAYVTTVVGAPGGKSHTRVEGMGKVFSEYGDRALLTADDPNFDNPADIANEIASYITSDITVEIIPDRKEAVLRGLNSLKRGDVLILAGKGTEDHQMVQGKQVPYIGDTQLLNQFIEK